MEQLILTSHNFAQTKRQAKGSFSLFSKLEKIADYDNVFIETDIPKIELQLNWEECFTPNVLYKPFMPLVSPKLYAYKFQYFGAFSVDGVKLSCGDENSELCCELFEAKMKNELIFRAENKKSELCNCSWLIDFLLHAEKIASDTLSNETLVWQQVNDGYEFVLEVQQTDKKLTERQIIYFQNNFESVSWQHHVIMR